MSTIEKENVSGSSIPNENDETKMFHYSVFSYFLQAVFYLCAFLKESIMMLKIGHGCTMSKSADQYFLCY